jgi:phosphonate transport system substrate-binding protein
MRGSLDPSRPFVRRVVFITAFVFFVFLRPVYGGYRLPPLGTEEKAFFQGVRHSEDVLWVGVLPLQSPTKLAKMFLPLCDYLSGKLGMKVVFVTAPDFTRFMQRYEAGFYDIVYSNPYQYVRARDKQGYSVFAKVAGEPFVGIFIARRNWGHRTFTADNLRGKTIAFVHPFAWASALMTSAHLLDKGIDPKRDMSVKYVGSQDSVILAVENGMADIGGTWRPSLRLMDTLADKIEVIEETAPQPQMPLSAHPRVPPEVVRKIRSLLVGLAGTEEGKEILKKLELPKGFTQASDVEYDAVRELADKLGVPY